MSCLFYHIEKRLDWKDNGNFNTDDIIHGKQTIAIHISPNISRSKGNQVTKFNQLIEYNMRNIFLKNHTQNMMEKPFTDPFLKNQN